MVSQICFCYMLTTRILKNLKVKKTFFLPWLRSIDADVPSSVNKDHIFSRKRCEQKILITISNFLVFFRYSRYFANVMLVSPTTMIDLLQVIIIYDNFRHQIKFFVSISNQITTRVSLFFPWNGSTYYVWAFDSHLWN